MSKLEDFKNEIKNKKVAVIGLGISNIPAVKTLVKYGAVVTAFDNKEEMNKDKEELISLGVKLVLGKDSLKHLNDVKYDYIFRSPGVKPFLEEIKIAVKNGSVLTSEVEEVVKLAPCMVIGITGSDGKTTTTTLTATILKEAGYNVFLGGNIGTPLFSKLDEMKENDIVVLELSSFQLMEMRTSVSRAAITNISPNHLDYHNSYEEYYLSKANIFLNKENSIVVLNKDNDKTEVFEKLIKGSKDIRYFSLNKGKFKGAYYFDNSLYLNNGMEIVKLVDKKDIKLVGIHNIANILTAISLIYDLVEINDIIKVITTFTGVEHRMEMFLKKDGIKWYNDSIGTSPTRTIAGLKAFDNKVILIAGGYDKHISYDDIGEVIVNKVKKLILLGDTRVKIFNSVVSYDKKFEDNITIVSNLEEAVKVARSFAKDGDNIVLSPASASFDLYKNFEERGNHFKNIVKNM